MNEIIMRLLELTVIITAFLGAKYVIPWLVEKTKTEKAVRYREKLGQIIEWVNAAVYAMEQSGRELSGSEKKSYVRKFIRETAKSVGVDLTDDEVDVLIEAAVKGMKLAEAEAGKAAEEDREDFEDCDDTDE